MLSVVCGMLFCRPTTDYKLYPSIHFMCLIVFAYKEHPEFDFIFAANRDEFYKRPTRPARFWEEEPHILAGKDLKAGGTWMGITKSGYFASLTNYRDPDMQKEDPPSRGHLVLDYLKQESDPKEYLKEIDTRAEQYDGFNIIVGFMNRLMYYSNREQTLYDIEPGVHGLSNHLLDTPWPKVQKAKSDLQKMLDEREEVDKESLFDLLKYDQPAPDEELPDTGIPQELERAVSPIFIKTDDYGTRSSTLLLIDKKGRVTFEERRFKAGTQEMEEVNRYSFSIG